MGICRQNDDAKAIETAFKIKKKSMPQLEGLGMVLLQSSGQINFKNEIQIEDSLNFCSKMWKKSLFLRVCPLYKRRGK